MPERDGGGSARSRDAACSARQLERPNNAPPDAPAAARRKSRRLIFMRGSLLIAQDNAGRAPIHLNEMPVYLLSEAAPTAEASRSRNARSPGSRSCSNGVTPFRGLAVSTTEL